MLFVADSDGGVRGGIGHPWGAARAQLRRALAREQRPQRRDLLLAADGMVLLLTY